MVSALNEDRLFPTDPEQRLIARRLYEAIKDRPIISLTDTSLSTGSRKTSISRTPPIYSSLLITT